MDALRSPRTRWIGTPVAHSKLTIAVQACFPRVRWESAPGPSEFASLLRRLILTTCALWDGHFGARFIGPYGPDGQSVSLAALLAIPGVGKSSQVAAILRGAILNPLRRRLSWSFAALRGLAGEPWHSGGESYLIGRESATPPDLNTGLDLHGHEELMRFCELHQIELRRRSVARRPRTTTVVDWWTDRIRAHQVEEAIGRQDCVAQMERTWRSKCSKSSTAGSTLPRAGRCEVPRSGVVAGGRAAASGYRGDRHT